MYCVWGGVICTVKTITGNAVHRIGLHVNVHKPTRQNMNQVNMSWKNKYN